MILLGQTCARQYEERKPDPRQEVRKTRWGPGAGLCHVDELGKVKPWPWAGQGMVTGGGKK